MQSRFFFSLAMLLAAMFGFADTTPASVIADPVGFIEALDEGDTLTRTLTLANRGNAAVNFEIKFDEPEDNNQGPRRDPIEGNFALFQDQNYFGLVDQAVFQRLARNEQGLRWTNFNQAQHLANADLSDFDAVWLVGCDQSDAFHQTWTQNRARFEDFIDRGKVMFVEEGWNRAGLDALPGGLREDRVPQEGILVVDPQDNWMIGQCAQV
ncbi:MAG: hypothetical protein FJY65_04360, partial [Calditrichaeota bacterium]|nr:hypothetical protein [Calditrichota bacterium]